jgi:tetratricopeptide (TPR) repeat protein
VQDGFIDPRRGERGEYWFTFQDLVLLRTATELTEKLSPRKVKRALRGLQDQLPRGRKLSGVRITSEGDAVLVRDGRATWNPESGQTLIDFEVSSLAAEVAPLAREQVESARESEERLGAEDWYDLGSDLESHAVEEARDAYRRCLELDPAHSDAHLNLGRILHELGEVEAAEKHYRLARAVRPRDGIAAFNHGVALEDLGRLNEAVQAYVQAVRVDPGHADAHFNLSQLYERMGRDTLALKHRAAYRKLVGEPGL